MRPEAGRPIFGAVLGHALVVVSDAHLGVAPPDVEERLLAFLEDVPALGDCLLVNGDLFDFWYSYSRVIPRRGFRVAAALAALGRRLPIVMVGGNHDRWGGDFWARETGIRYEPSSASFEVGHRRVLAIHGDGLDEPGFRAALLHRLINHPITAAVYRSIHPDLGLRLVDKLSPHLGNHEPNATLHDAVAERQRVWAERRLL
ncbi:MAG: UDP-2,3-diacylglucosamine diphosphatase, partial [Gemmatimonadales bacterium]